MIEAYFTFKFWAEIIGTSIGLLIFIIWIVCTIKENK